MDHQEFTCESYDGLELYTQCWLPDASEPPRAVLAIVHGVGEHCGRYDTLVDGLVPQGYAVWGFDLRGHGRSPGQRGHIDAWADYRGDVTHVLADVQSHLPDTPLFLYGHSMGSLIVLDYVLREPAAAAGLAGTIVSGVPLEPAGVASPFLIRVAKIMSRIWPRFSLSPGLQPEDVSCDPDVQAAYAEDPLVHPKVSARWGTESLKTVAWIKARANRMTCPLLMVHGADDPLNLVQGVVDWYAQVPCEDKALRIYPGNRHEVHNDAGRDQLVADLSAWMAEHIVVETASAD